MRYMYVCMLNLTRFQYVKQLLEDQADFRLFVSDPVLPWTTAIIILSMMYKRVNLTAMFLIAAFIFSLNPVYVVMLALFWGVLSLSSKSPKLHLPIKKKSRSPVAIAYSVLYCTVLFVFMYVCMY